jgi:D-alanine-D-alanine ligase
MDKMKTKSIYQSVDLPVAKSIKVQSKSLLLKNDMKIPYVIKPVNGGSSVGISFVNRKEDLRHNDNNYHGEVMLEEFIPGRELTVTVLNDVPLTVTEIITESWYDYEAKYSENGSSHIVPANLPNKIFDACKKYALRAHHALGCRGISRTDLRWDDTKGLAGIILLETNTQPGMTPTSLTPEQAKFCGISFEGLCKSLIEDASCNR